MNCNNKLILITILLAFFFRGVFLVGVFPIFKGQDESRHYNTVQYLAIEKYSECEKDEEGKFIKNNQSKQDLTTYRYSDEIRELASVIQSRQVRGNYYDKVNFKKNKYDGFGEVEFKHKKHFKVQHFCPPDMAHSTFGKEGFSLYQWGISRVEKSLNLQNIFVRYDMIRIISVLLGIIMLWISYCVFRTVRFSEKQSLILTAIISFQPKLVTYFTNINYDVLLIPLWTGFILVGSLIVRRGWNFSRGMLLVIILAGAIMTKPSALPLLGLGVFLLGRTIHKKFRKEKINWIVVGGVILVGGFVGYLLLDKVGLTSLLSEKYLNSLGEYLSKSLPKIYGSSRDYWGAMGWNANNLTLMYVKIIWVIEWIAWAGLALLVVGPKFNNLFKKTLAKIQQMFLRKLIIGNHKKTQKIRKIVSIAITNSKRKLESRLINLDKEIKRNIKNKKYFWFMLSSVIVLQIGIRVADWRVFTGDGSLSLGTPGRYWLPNIVPHFVLLAMGLKSITSFSDSRKVGERYFNISLLIFLVLMILYWCYEVFDIIIPRFYL